MLSLMFSLVLNNIFVNFSIYKNAGLSAIDVKKFHFLARYRFISSTNNISNDYRRYNNESYCI